MVEVMKIMATSFKRSHACTATLSASDPEAGHCQPTLLPETPGHSWACLGQFLVGPLLLSPGSWCTQGFVCACQEALSPVECKFCGSVVGLMVTSFKRAYAIPTSAAPRAPGRPLLARISTGDTQMQLRLSLCGLGVRFVPFPGLSSSGDQVLGKRTVPGEPCFLITSPIPAYQSPRCTVRAPSPLDVCLLWRADLSLRPSSWMSTILDLRKT